MPTWTFYALSFLLGQQCSALIHSPRAFPTSQPSPQQVYYDGIWGGTQYFTFWQLGQQLFDSEKYSACFPGEISKQPPPDVPCLALAFFFPNCTYGVSLQEVYDIDPVFLLHPFDSGAEFRPLSNDSQQACYCSSDYWEYVQACNACMMGHPPSDPPVREQEYPFWLPPNWIDQQSSSYCRNPATAAVIDFFASFSPTGNPFNAYPTLTASAIASNNTAVSAYATLTAIASDAPQTSQTGTLSPTATPTPTATSTSGGDSIHATCASTPAGWLAF